MNCLALDCIPCSSLPSQAHSQPNSRVFLRYSQNDTDRMKWRVQMEWVVKKKGNRWVKLNRWYEQVTFSIFRTAFLCCKTRRILFIENFFAIQPDSAMFVLPIFGYILAGLPAQLRPSRHFLLPIIFFRDYWHRHVSRLAQHEIAFFPNPFNSFPFYCPSARILSFSWPLARKFRYLQALRSRD